MPRSRFRGWKYTEHGRERSYGPSYGVGIGIIFNVAAIMIDPATMPERCYTMLKSVNEFDKQNIRGIVRMLLVKADRDTCFVGNYYRAVANVESLLRMPTANAHCERLIGTIRRECLDYLIAFDADHLRRILREWICHYNAGRPHRSLGPGIPEQVQQNPQACSQADQSQQASRVIAKPTLGGLHHEYRWDTAA